jgi:regulator of RNase E activity RraA
MAARRKVKPGAVTGTALIRRLQRQASETISDVLDVMGLPHQVLAAEIRPIPPVRTVAGPAFCVRGRPVTPDTPTPAGTQFEVDRQLKPGMVVVMATGGHTASAVAGGNVAASYKKRGCAGMVLHGAVRDAAEIRSFLPVFATHVTPKRPGGRFSVVAHGEPIELPGQGPEPVIVHPGDLILADADGVVVVPQAIALDVVEAAEKLVKLEAEVLADIRRGTDREAALKAHDRYGHIRKIVPSSP